MSYIDQCLMSAAIKGKSTRVLELLAEGADPKYINSRALAMAACFGNIDCLEILLPLSDPKGNDSHALRLAAANGHAECLKLLIPVSDPKADNFEALKAAHHFKGMGKVECARLLAEPCGFGLVVDEIVEIVASGGILIISQIEELQRVRQNAETKESATPHA